MDDLAQRVSAKLRIEEENRIRSQQQFEEDETNSCRKEEEQKKRWTALRGSPNKQQDQQQQQQNYVTPPLGRGRGRGVIALNNLRRPGEKAPTVTGEEIRAEPKVPPGFQPNNAPTRMGMGRGTMLHSNRSQSQATLADENTSQSNDDQDKWAGPAQPPSAAEAPRPPRAWMS